MIDTTTLRAKLERLKGERDQLLREHTVVEEQLRRNKRDLIRLEKALAIVKQVGLITQRQLEYHLANQVSLAMAAVFDDPYQLKVTFEEKRGRTEVQLTFCRRGIECFPIGSVGGGVLNVASFSLRAAYWSMRQNNKVRNLLLLDEPFSQLKGEEANRRALEIVREISHRLELQIIMVSDERVSRSEILENSDNVVYVSQDSDGVSELLQLVSGEKEVIS